MQGKCKLIGTIYLVLGMLRTVLTAWYSASFIVLIVGAFEVIAQVIILYTLDEILETVTSIRYYSFRKENNESFYDDESNHGRNRLSNGGWKCPECGKMNASYVGTCACGYNKKSDHR